MFNIFANAQSGMNAYQEKLDYLSNDLVNTSTTGYKATDVQFSDLLTESLDRKGTPLVNKDAINGTGVKLGMDYRKDTQGNLLTTGIKTDIAIDGKGYIASVQQDGTIAYTRDGNLKIDSNGTLVDARGNKIYIQYEDGMSEGSPKLSSEDISIDGEGGISTKVDNQYVKVGQIPVFTAVGDKAFVAIGNNYFVASDDAQIALSNDYNIEQGMLEGSNVDTSEIFTDIISTQRAFQLSSKGITTADEVWGMINGMRK
ncbi:flagellar basal body rod protein FlgG [Clostridium botulinum]|uniref:flagellar basal-body rod protein FlgG n=1 Tax=Clostridium TaxID=1485 RepID=UPI000507B5AF|nr:MULTISPECIES: flagellar basal-body rod protein FlgG [unclassified Clostridium]AIY80994.1 flagellar hook-basal body family protein [Clostridium botulinum 202F]KAI3348256.1 flagellar basal body rod protein FlgG [Clostridium botulinum]KFX57942.1 flagellar basal body rod protein FlgG [Clostridium botulinum]KFX58832.1 flagellar basal body rod protein FlgG [Clostridium botulinum]KON12912.1 flagellar basal body rod protein FlgG [Clostridium botulinum]